MGRLIAVGIMPVEASSAGSRTSIRIGVESGEAAEGEEGRVDEICVEYWVSVCVVVVPLVRDDDDGMDGVLVGKGASQGTQ